MTTPARLAALLAEHRPVWAHRIPLLVRCECGEGATTLYDEDAHDAHVAGVLHAELRPEIRTVAEADQLPHGTVLLCGDTVYITPALLIADDLPGVVIHQPKEA